MKKGEGNTVNETPAEETPKEESAFEYFEKNLDGIFVEEDNPIGVDDAPVVETPVEEPPVVESDTPSEPEVSDAEEDKDKKDEVELVPIPQEQVDIARSLGFSDEEIVKMAESTPDRLVKFVEAYNAPKRGVEELKPVEPTAPTKVEHTKPEDFGDLDPDLADSLSRKMNGLIDVLNKQNEELHSLGEHRSQVIADKKVAESRRIDNIFDEASEFVPEFGKGKLTRSQAQARTETYAIATILQKTRGLDESKALEEAIYLYDLGKINIQDLEKKAEERVKEKINNHKKLMSPRPGGNPKVGEAKEGRQAALEHLTQGLKEMFG